MQGATQNGCSDSKSDDNFIEDGNTGTSDTNTNNNDKIMILKILMLKTIRIITKTIKIV